MLRGCKEVDWGSSPADVCNSAGSSLFNEIELTWQIPRIWRKTDSKPEFEENNPFLYVLLRDHGNAQSKDQIVYVGLTSSPRTRFGNHKTAKQIVAKRGTVRFTYASVDLQGKNKIKRTNQAMQELEHLLIWAVPGGHLINQKKQFTLPGMGSLGGNAWHIINKGYRFSGQMPREIIYPWMMIKPGRDRSMK